MLSLEIGPVTIILDSVGAVEVEENFSSSGEELRLYSDNGGSPVILLTDRAEEIRQEIFKLKGWTA